MYLAIALFACLATEDIRTYRVIVTEKDGSPIAGAEVALNLPEWNGPFNPVTIIARSQSNSKGIAEITFSTRSWLGKIPDTAIWVIAPDNRLGLRGLPAEDDDAEIHLRFEWPTRWQIQVTDPMGKPVTDAKVAPYMLDNSSNRSIVPREWHERLTARTDQSGCVDLTCASPKEVVALMVEHTQFGRQEFRAYAQRESLSNIRLNPPTSIKGRIVSETVFDPAGIRVQVQTRARRGALRDGEMHGYAESAVDHQGRFEVPAIAGGIAWIDLRFSDTTLLIPDRNRWPALEAGRNNEVEIRLLPGVSVVGRVVDRESKQPVEGAKISLHFNSPDGGRGIWPVFSDKDGFYRACVLPGAIHFRMAMAADYFLAPDVGKVSEPRRSIQIPASDKPIQLPAIELERLRSVSGIVVDELGGPARGTVVKGIQDVPVMDGAWRTQLSVETRANHSGHFRLQAKDLNQPVEIWATAETAYSREMTLAELGKRDLRLVVSSKDMVTLSGKVIDNKGRAVANASIRLNGQVCLTVPYKTSTIVIHIDVVAVSDSQGRYRFRRLQPADGRFGALAQADGFDDSRIPMDRVQRDANGNAVLPDILLHARTVVTGTVIDAAGNSVAGAKLKWLSPIAKPIDTVAGKDGGFRFDGLSHPAGLLLVKAVGKRNLLLSVLPSMKELTVSMADANAQSTLLGQQ